MDSWLHCRSGCKRDRGDEPTVGSVSTTGKKDLVREATGWQRPAYSTQQSYYQGSGYPVSGNSKGWSGSGTGYDRYQPGYPSGNLGNTKRGGYYMPNQGGIYPGYQGGYVNQGGYYGGQGGYGGAQGGYIGGQSGYVGGQGGYVRGQGGYIGNQAGYPAAQPGYGNNKGWTSGGGSGWSGNVGVGNVGEVDPGLVDLEAITKEAAKLTAKEGTVKVVVMAVDGMVEIKSTLAQVEVTTGLVVVQDIEVIKDHMVDRMDQEVMVVNNQVMYTAVLTMEEATPVQE
ncbi:uncharacterized protein CEXT_74681 [Caerostris extrusa]|uniref:Uncharacterized protein n=1 Tax=Caerostris extrusa TaxID=172846 RepID=A0AAV4T8E8_CAEEX|nr:uncharacterized protein CEXT_74681 [Caerostris extrusa]